MSAETLIKLGGTQNKAWVECKFAWLDCNKKPLESLLE